MDPVLGINANTPLISSATTGAINPAGALLASELSLAPTGLFGSSSTLVELSATGQLLSAASVFQNRLQSLQPGTSGSGGGQNFGTDFASLAAEVQSFVDAFNSLQNSIAGISNTGSLLGANVAGATALSQSLDAQVQATFTSGSAALTNLAQLGVEFHPSPLPDGTGSLTLNLGTLQTAFNSNAAGAFTLLSSAATTLADLAGHFVTGTGGQSSSFAALAQASLGTELLANGLLSQARTNDNLSSLLAIESMTGTANLQQVILAINEYTLVSGLLA